MNATEMSGLRRVAIVDDSRDDAEMAADLVLDCGFEPQILPLQRDLPSMLRQIEASSDILLCDHRLHVLGDVPYNGARLLAHWVDTGQPSCARRSLAECFIASEPGSGAG